LARQQTEEWLQTAEGQAWQAAHPECGVPPQESR
jgi:hypothetical protein